MAAYRVREHYTSYTYEGTYISEVTEGNARETRQIAGARARQWGLHQETAFCWKGDQRLAGSDVRCGRGSECGGLMGAES
jgi:hypothetical protein